MDALVKFGREDKQVEMRDIPQPPDPPPGQVVVEVGAAGVCGSDLHMWARSSKLDDQTALGFGTRILWRHRRRRGRSHRLQGWRPRRSGDGGRRSVANAFSAIPETTTNAHTDWDTAPCMTARSRVLSPLAKAILHHIPANVPFEYAALTEPICVAYNALVEKTPVVRPGDTVVIQGPGPIGMMALIVAKLRGASEIIMLGTNLDKTAPDNRRTNRRHQGHSISTKTTRSNWFARLGDGYGADLIVDCTGVSIALKSALEMVRPNGVITKIGWGPQPLNYNLDPLVQKAVTLQGAFSHLYSTWERALGLLSSGQIDLELIIGGVYSLGNWVEAFEEMEAGNNVKSVLLPA